MAKLGQLRKQIDEIDDSILDLLIKRFAITQDISVEKARTGAEPLDNERWASISARLSKKAQSAGLNSDEIMQVFEAIHSYVLRNIYKTKE